MLERLGKIVDEIAALQTKLILLVGEPGSGKTPLLVKLADSRDGQVLNVGVVLGKRLAALPHRQRPLKVNEELKALADDYVCEKDLVLLDNIELLFDQSLKLDPLELLKRHAHSRRVVAVWPGDLREGRLSYAVMGHSEYQDYGLDGIVPFEINKNS